MLVMKSGFRPELGRGTFNYENKSRPSGIQVNVLELDSKFELEVAAPGLKKEDFELNVEKDVLSIAAERSRDEKEGVKVLRNEFGNYNFKRSFQLADTIDADNIKASYKNGVLQVTLPKKEKEAPKVVAVK